MKCERSSTTTTIICQFYWTNCSLEERQTSLRMTTGCVTSALASEVASEVASSRSLYPVPMTLGNKNDLPGIKVDGSWGVMYDAHPPYRK